MLLAGEENLREVVLFPMNQRAEDLLMGAPSPATPKQLRELHIRVSPAGEVSACAATSAVARLGLVDARRRMIAKQTEIGV